MTITTNDSQIATRLLDPKTRRAAFEQMVDIYSEQLYWQIRRLVFVHEDADDILQNVFLKHGRTSIHSVTTQNSPPGSTV